MWALVVPVLSDRHYGEKAPERSQQTAPYLVLCCTAPPQQSKIGTMEIEAGISKIVPVADDVMAIRTIERPKGGLSIILVESLSRPKFRGKSLCSAIAEQVAALLATGVRDGAAARAASDTLFTDYDGSASARLSIASADLQSGTLVISTNGSVPYFVASNGEVTCLNMEAAAIGTERNIRPTIHELPLEPGLALVMYTSGIERAGELSGQNIDICAYLETSLESEGFLAQQLADELLAEAARLQEAKKSLPLGVVALHVGSQRTDGIHRTTYRIPVSEQTHV